VKRNVPRESYDATQLSELFGSRAFVKRAFRCSAPATWNSLPRTVTDNDSLGTFKSRLKSFLFYRFVILISKELYSC